MLKILHSIKKTYIKNLKKTYIKKLKIRSNYFFTLTPCLLEMKLLVHLHHLLLVSLASQAL